MRKMFFLLAVAFFFKPSELAQGATIKGCINGPEFSFIEIYKARYPLFWDPEPSYWAVTTEGCYQINVPGGVYAIRAVDDSFPRQYYDQFWGSGYSIWEAKHEVLGDDSELQADFTLQPLEIPIELKRDDWSKVSVRVKVKNTFSREFGFLVWAVADVVPKGRYGSTYRVSQEAGLRGLIIQSGKVGQTYFSLVPPPNTPVGYINITVYAKRVPKWMVPGINNAAIVQRWPKLRVAIFGKEMREKAWRAAGMEVEYIYYEAR